MLLARGRTGYKGGEALWGAEEEKQGWGQVMHRQTHHLNFEVYQDKNETTHVFQWGSQLAIFLVHGSCSLQMGMETMTHTKSRAQWKGTDGPLADPGHIAPYLQDCGRTMVWKSQVPGDHAAASSPSVLRTKFFYLHYYCHL